MKAPNVATRPAITLREQVAAAKAEVATWPASVQQATKLRADVMGTLPNASLDVHHVQ